MALYAIGDLHLCLGAPKPMDVFGAHWENHFERICESWRSQVGGEDVVCRMGYRGTGSRFQLKSRGIPNSGLCPSLMSLHSTRLRTSHILPCQNGRLRQSKVSFRMVKGVEGSRFQLW